MKNWFDNLQPRERAIVLAAVALLIPLLIYLLLWEPASRQVDTLRMSVNAAQKQLSWMQKAQQEVRSLEASGKTASVDSGVSLIQAVERSSSVKKLRQYFKRIEPQGNDKIAIDMENAPFDEVIAWIDELQTRYGANVAQFNASRSSEPGRIEARLILARGEQ